jgi:hypothetical protein
MSEANSCVDVFANMMDEQGIYNYMIVNEQCLLFCLSFLFFANQVEIFILKKIIM